MDRGRPSRGPVLSFRGPFGSARHGPSAGHIPQEGVLQAVRRYELMLVIRPDAPDDKVSAVIDRTTRYLVAAGGQIIKVAPWGRRRLAYPIDRHREGSYHIIVFEAPAEAIAEMERSLLITEEVLRHLVTRAIRPVKARRDASSAEVDDTDLPSAEDELEEEDGERIDESESEAAPAAID
jgi:small subunit ribosomal protein S6